MALLVRLAKSLAYDDLVQQKQIDIRMWENYSKIFKEPLGHNEMLNIIFEESLK